MNRTLGKESNLTGRIRCRRREHSHDAPILSNVLGRAEGEIAWTSTAHLISDVTVSCRVRGFRQNGCATTIPSKFFGIIRDYPPEIEIETDDRTSPAFARFVLLQNSRAGRAEDFPALAAIQGDNRVTVPRKAAHHAQGKQRLPSHRRVPLSSEMHLPHPSRPQDTMVATDGRRLALGMRKPTSLTRARRSSHTHRTPSTTLASSHGQG